MMTTKRSGRWAVAKTFLVIPAILLAAMIFSTPASGIYVVQDSKPKVPPKSAEVVQSADVQPAYPGGFEAMSKFLAANIKYPEQAKKNHTEGKVFVSFVVQPDGSLTDVKIQKGIGNGCDEETLRVIKLMPKWEPGKLKGKPVAASMTLPVYFKLDSDKAKEQPK